MEIVRSCDVETQEQLLELLLNAGFSCTQATVSRDIKELRIIKEQSQLGTYRYAAPVNETTGTFSSRLNAIFRECVTGYDYAQNIVVIHTIPGLAAAAASSVDAMKTRMVLGCIGGDDTVIIVMRDSGAAAAFCMEIRNLLN